MPTSYTDQAYAVDIAAVFPGQPLTVVSITLIDQDDDGRIEVGETINGLTITRVWVGDTVTVDGTLIRGVTFETTGSPFFTPNDGSVLFDGTVNARTVVSQSTFMPVSTLGPPCFVRGTMILTPRGEVPVEDLKVGDLVVTRDSGAQELTWVGAARTHGTEKFAPVRIEAGVLGNRDVLEVSQQHRILLGSAEIELHFGTHEVLVAAKHLVGHPGITLTPRAQVDYVHIMFSQHEIVSANGAWSESFFYGDQELAGFETAARAELESIFADNLDMDARFAQTSRYCLKSFEAAMISTVEGMRPGL